jgi:threonine/homoserine/homoserine lactone efflux protein
MQIISALLFGFFTAIIGIIPPGLINMTAAKVSLKEGRRNAIFFILGAILVISFQTFFAIVFAKIINRRPDLVTLFREVGLGIFATLTIYFLVLAKKPKDKTKSLKKNSKTNRFFLGMLLSILNFLPIPYYVFISITLASFHLFSFDRTSVLIFVNGVILGSFFVFYCYITFFNRIESKTDYLSKNINTIIGCITGMISVITLWNIIQYYW